MKNNLCLFSIIFLIFSCSSPPEEKVKERVSVDEKTGVIEPEEKAAFKTRTPDASESEPGMELLSLNDSSSRSASSESSVSGLMAGFADDNRQFGYFARFLEEYGYVPHLEMNISERIVIKIKDAAGKSFPNTPVEIISNGKTLVNGKTTTDGIYQFNPSEYGKSNVSYRLKYRTNTGIQTAEFSRDGPRTVEINSDSYRVIEEPVPLDIVFVMDTTGSMGEEILRLKRTIEIIALNLESMPVTPLLRFGMVLYRDIEDEYHTRQIPLTDDLDEFQSQLNKVEANGGGDFEEDLQKALDETLNQMEWNTSDSGIRLAFIITDAPPHLDYEQNYTYVDAAKDARQKALKIFSIGTGGLPLEGEYILRQIAQYTGGKYIFLTYGEKGESEGGKAGAVSHHSGANWNADKLESIIIRFAKEELSQLSDSVLEKDDPYFEAKKLAEEKQEETLENLFNQAIVQLSDFSSLKLEINTKLAILPLKSTSDDLKLNAEYFSEQILLAASASENFTLVERKDLNKLMEEMELQLSGLTSEEGTAKLGAILNAEVLISGQLYRKKSRYEIILKLLRVETGEILSVTKAKLDFDLGL